MCMLLDGKSNKYYTLVRTNIKQQPTRIQNIHATYFENSLETPHVLTPLPKYLDTMIMHSPTRRRTTLIIGTTYIV